MGATYSLVAVVAALGMLAWPVPPVPQRWTPLRQAHQGAGALDVWRQTLKVGRMGDRVGWSIASVRPEAVIVCDWEQATPLWYVQQVEGQRPDVQIVYPVERLDEAAATGRPLYIARAHDGLAERWHPSGSDALISLQDEPTFGAPETLAALGSQLGSFELVGYRYGVAPHHDQRRFDPGEVVPVTLVWRALEPSEHDYSVSVRLLNERGDQVAQVDSQHPVLGTYPTSRWTAGEVVRDYHELQLPHDLAPGAFRWGVILYRALPEGGWESLKVDGTGSEMAQGGVLEVQ
jgi:hypothetical protein